MGFAASFGESNRVSGRCGREMKKYAIYKGETGYYYKEYIDTPERLEGTPFADMIAPESLPVILDSESAYHPFDAHELEFVEIIESELECPLTVEQMYFKNHESFKLGWMSPDGDTYSCSFTNHTKAAKQLAEKFCPDARLPERALGKAGWLKIIDSWDGTSRQHKQFVYSVSGKITKRQADRLFDLGLYGNEEVERMIADCADNW